MCICACVREKEWCPVVEVGAVLLFTYCHAPYVVVRVANRANMEFYARLPHSRLLLLVARIRLECPPSVCGVGLCV